MPLSKMILCRRFPYHLTVNIQFRFFGMMIYYILVSLLLDKCNINPDSYNLEGMDSLLLSEQRSSLSL